MMCCGDPTQPPPAHHYHFVCSPDCLKLYFIKYKPMWGEPALPAICIKAAGFTNIIKGNDQCYSSDDDWLDE